MLRLFLILVILLLTAASSVFAVSSKNPGVYEVSNSKTYDRVIAISDTHGQYKKTLDLLRAQNLVDRDGHWIAGRALFVVLGDTINKGDYSIELLDFWIRLQKEAQKAGGQLVHTLGNHEAKLLSDPSFIKKHPELTANLKKRGLTRERFISSTSVRGKFLRNMPVGVRVGNVFFQHAGLPPNYEWKEYVAKSRKKLRANDFDDDLFLGKNSSLEARINGDHEKEISKIYSRMERLDLTTLVFGHQSDVFGVENSEKIIGLDAINEEKEDSVKLLIKIDAGMGDGEKGRILIFNKPTEMFSKTPPEEILRSSRKSVKTKPLNRCMLYFEGLAD